MQNAASHSIPQHHLPGDEDTRTHNPMYGAWRPGQLLEYNNDAFENRKLSRAVDRLLGKDILCFDCIGANVEGRLGTDASMI